MVQAMVQLAKNLGMMPLAEGVETSEELAFLRALDCPHGSGVPVLAARFPPERSRRCCRRAQAVDVPAPASLRGPH